MQSTMNMLRFMPWLLCAVYPVRAHENIAFPDGPPPAEIVDVVRVSRDYDERITATLLQGLANRGDRARVLLDDGAVDTRFWIQVLQDKGYVAQRRDLTFQQFVDEYAPQVCSRVIMYDPGQDATINLATMMAAMTDALVIAPGMETIIPQALSDITGGVIYDMRNRIWTNSKVAAYNFAYNRYWDVTEGDSLIKTVVAHVHPSHIQLRDYLVQHKIYTGWITGDEIPATDPSSNPSAELARFTEVLATSPPNIPLLGWWGVPQDDSLREFEGVGFAGEYGKYTVASSTAINLSFMNGIDIDLAADVQAYRDQLDFNPPRLRNDKVYLSMNIADSGGAINYHQYRQYEVWQEPARGSVPINWSTNYLNFELQPPVAEYFLKQATPEDYLYLHFSGIGYVHPYRDFMSMTPDPDAAWQEYIDLTRTAMLRIGGRELEFYLRTWVDFTHAAYDPTTLRFIQGIPELDQVMIGLQAMESMPGDLTYLLGDRPAVVSHMSTRIPTNWRNSTDEAMIQFQVDQILNNTPAERPAFMHIQNLSWVYGPEKIAEVLSRIGDEYVPLSLPEFNHVYRQYRGLVEWESNNAVRPELFMLFE